MGKTYILGNNKDLAKYLEYDFIEIPTIMCSNDYEIHNWLVNVFQHNEIEKLVIEIGSDEVLPFQIAYHIRLSINELKYKSLIPILFVSTTTLNSIVLKASLWSHILSTKGFISHQSAILKKSNWSYPLLKKLHQKSINLNFGI